MQGRGSPDFEWEMFTDKDCDKDCTVRVLAMTDHRTDVCRAEVEKKCER